MITFNIVLVWHVLSFLLFLMQLAVLFPQKEKRLHSKAIFVGLSILVTGILLVIMKYPAINLYKIIPKSVLFVAIFVFCGVYSGKNIPVKIYYLMVSMTVLASLIATVKV